jgi:AcrR family transcriptional regulator
MRQAPERTRVFRAGEPDVRRVRIVEAMVLVVCERGFAGASVAAVCARAGVSRQGFYEHFCGREDCFLAVIDDAYRQASTITSDAYAQAKDWREGLRDALARLLCLFDREPLLARAWLVESLAAGSWALERRALYKAAMTRQAIEAFPPPPGVVLDPLVPEGVLTAVLGIVQTHALNFSGEPLLTLLGPLMGVIFAPYLDRDGVAREVTRGEALARELLAVRDPEPPLQRPAVRLPSFLRDPRAHRARTCLRYLAEHPGASNRQVTDAIGVREHSQTSALLARLARAGLLEKYQGQPGHANEWCLTHFGRQAFDASTSHISRPPSDFTITS